MHPIIISVLFWTALSAILPCGSARAEIPYVDYASILSGDTPAPYATIYLAILENFRLHHARIPFPRNATGVAASYTRFQARDIYNAVETYSLLEILNGTDAAHPLDNGRNAAGNRQERLRDLIAWNLWLISREGVNYHWNNPLGKDGPWLEARLRGWGSANFQNASSNFLGWHTYSEQTSQPLIGLFQTAIALEQLVEQDPALADQPVFEPATIAAFRQSGYMNLVTPTITDDITLSGCVASRDACRYEYGNLTYRQAAALLRVFGGAVLDWWIGHAMTKTDGLEYFWYTSRGDRLFASTGIPARDWFIVHANMLMGRAAFLYAKLSGDAAYSDLSVRLYRGFLAAHHDCRRGNEELTCYHYGVLGKPLAGLTERGQFGEADPATIKTTPPGALEEPYHMNSSQALVGLMNGKSLLNSRDMLADDGEWLPRIQQTFLAAYRVPLPEAPCFFFTAFQCANAFVTGPPVLHLKYNLFWEIGHAEKAIPRETLTVAGKTFTVPNYAEYGDALAAFYLTEGASAETFQLLYQWWDGYARRVELGNMNARCLEKGTCRNVFDGSNFPKMGAFLAAAAFQKQHDAPLSTSAAGRFPRHMAAAGSCAAGGSGAEGGLTIAVLLCSGLLRHSRAKRARAKG
jgi:hypothetical protein